MSRGPKHAGQNAKKRKVKNKKIHNVTLNEGEKASYWASREGAMRRRIASRRAAKKASRQKWRPKTSAAA